MPGLVGILLLGAGCVWIIFQSLLPVIAAIVLLLGTASEYLFPVTFSFDEDGVSTKGLTNRSALKWSEVKRVLIGSKDVVLTPLPVPSRLDEFRGVVIRFAANGQTGDRESVLGYIREVKPELLGAENANE